MDLNESTNRQPPQTMGIETSVFADEITAPQLRSVGLIGKALTHLQAIAETQYPHGTYNPADKHPEGKAIVSPELKEFMGVALGHAMLREDWPATEAIGRIWALDSEYYDNEFLETALKTLQSEGRLDLARPMVAALLGSCLQRWRADRPNREGDFPQYLNTLAFPDFHSLTPVQEDKSHQKADAIIRGLRGATSWLVLGQNLSAAVGKVESRLDAEISPAFLQTAVDIVTTLEEARPWAIHVLTSAMERQDTGWNEDEELGWLQCVKRLVPLTTGAEAAGLLRRCADRVHHTRLMENKIGVRQIEHLAHMVIAQHPNQSVDDWLTASIAHEVLPTIRTSRHDCVQERKAIMSAPPIVADWAGAHPRAIRICETYDILMGWMDLTRILEMKAITQQRLRAFMEQSEAALAPLPVLRAALDRWALSQEHKDPSKPSGRVEKKPTPSGRRDRRRSL